MKSSNTIFAFLAIVGSSTTMLVAPVLAEGAGCSNAAPSCPEGFTYCSASQGCSFSGCTADNKCGSDFLQIESVCDSPIENACGDTFCESSCICGDTSNTCVVLDCESLQRENCASSLPDGTCNADGSDCPITFQCSFDSFFNSYSLICVPPSTETASPTNSPSAASTSVGTSAGTSTGTTETNSSTSDDSNCQGPFDILDLTCDGDGSNKCSTTGFLTGSRSNTLDINGVATTVTSERCGIPGSCTFDCCAAPCKFTATLANGQQMTGGDPSSSALSNPMGTTLLAAVVMGTLLAMIV